MAENKEKMKVVAFHGWACDRRDWKAWLTSIPAEYSFELWDRGYFGNESRDLSTDVNIVITHSMGLLQVPESILKQTKVLIALQPFAYFPSRDIGIADGVMKQLDRMIMNMSKRPVDQIQAFRRQADLSNRDMHVSELNVPLLSEDLHRLKTERIRENLIKAIPKVVWIHEEQDSIIHSRCKVELQNEYPDHVHLMVGQGSHSFCLKFPETIISRFF
jgi:hypothetical protein